MNKRIRSLIDDIFAEMKMTAENLALRDELMANAQAHYEDEIAKGSTEEEALQDVAASLEDVRGLLAKMNETEAPKEPAPKKKPAPFWSLQAEEEEKAREDAGEKPVAGAPKAQEGTGLEDVFEKAFGALGDFGRQILPQTRKILRKADEAAGEMLDGLGRAMDKGVRGMTNASGSVPEKKKTSEEKKPETATPEELRKRAADIRAQAELKQAAGDQEGARDMRREAYTMEMRADAAEQQAALDAAHAAQKDAEEPDETADRAESEEQTESEDRAPWLGADGEIDREKFAKAVDDLSDQAAEAAQHAHDEAFRMTGKADTVLTQRFAAAGLQKLDVALDADDVCIEACAGDSAEVIWEAGSEGGEAPACTVSDHCLLIRRENPDLFKTFFSVFKKEGGKVTLRVPGGYGLRYAVRTTSGDISLTGVDADEVSVNTTSGDVRISPDTGKRADRIEVNTVSGDVAISACAGDIAAKTVTGDLFVSCDASSVDADSVSGKMHVEGACDTWEINSVSGDAELLCTAVPVGKITIGTVSAAVRLSLPAGIRGFTAEAGGPMAQQAIVNEFGPNRYGTCALPIRMDTMSGKLIITRL